MRGIPGNWFEEKIESEKLGEILMDQHVINKSQLACALDIAKERGQQLGKTLIDLAIVSEEQLLHALEVQETRTQ